MCCHYTIEQGRFFYFNGTKVIFFLILTKNVIFFSGTGKTLDAAIGEISQKTGLKVSLSQCNLIVLGNMFLTEQTFPSVNYLVQTFSVPELAIIAVAENSAAELLKTKPVMTTLSAVSGTTRR